MLFAVKQKKEKMFTDNKRADISVSRKHLEKPHRSYLPILNTLSNFLSKSELWPDFLFALHQEPNLNLNLHTYTIDAAPLTFPGEEIRK